MKLTLKTLDDGSGSDMIVVYDGEGTPQGTLHIDTFYDKMPNGEQNQIYEKLSRGESVVVELDFAKSEYEQ